MTVGVSGRLRNNGEDDPLELPAVGDWVLADADSIQEVLARRTAFVRRAAGLDAVPQVIAANIDTVFLVAGLDGDLSSRRLERYLALTWQSGATPVVVLTKSDLVDDVDGALATVRSVVDDVNVHVVSNVTSEGIEDVRRELGEGITVAVLGSSGVGKSTLVNLLVVGQVQDIGDVRADGRGRHTTIRRELVLVPGGGLLLDTPGLREVQLWDSWAGLDEAFPDIAAAAANCRFNDCWHDGEPGCAVEAAVAAGELRAMRLESYRRLATEQAELDEQVEQRRRRRSRGIRPPRRTGTRRSRRG